MKKIITSIGEFLLSESQRDWFMIALLAMQNLVIFKNHYFRDYGFPWDFIGGYYSMVAFWTSIVSQGVYPSWVPYPQMGIPSNLLLQSGIHYPPLWIFPLLKIEYTLYAAVIFQCLHILFGAIGMFFLLRLLLHTTPYVNLYALFGAFVYQLFGGFYSNAEHVDIIRAFSFLPWLFYFFSISDVTQTKIPRRFFLIPLIILLVMTGAYPGNIVSGMVIAALYFLFQLINWYQRERKITAIISLTALVLTLTILGLGLSFFHLGPSWLYKDYLFRSVQIDALSFFSLGVEHIPSLFLETNMALGEISMTSTYITLPILILVSYIPLRVIKRQWPMVGVLIFSLLMVAGPRSFFWYIVTRLIDPLKYSRFPASDYRAFIAIVIIYFAVLALLTLVDREIKWKGFLFRTAFVFMWFFQGVYVNYPILRSAPVYKVVTIFFVTIIGLAFYLFNKKRYRYEFLSFVMFLFILISVDAFRVLPKLEYVFPDGRSVSTWQVPSFSTVYQANNWPLMENGNLLTYEIIQNTPYMRPARNKPQSRMEIWVDFITGKYNTGGHFSPILQSAYIINNQKIYEEFMLKEWVPLFFENHEINVVENSVKIPLELMKTQLDVSTDENLTQVRQLFYGMNEIEYSVSLEQPMLMVENETYFPGWKAVIASDQGTSEIQATSVNDVFRAWLLPAGSYTMVARFEFPYTRVYNGISIIALIIWVFLSYRFINTTNTIHVL
jgi:hypothetical protein